jgi:hypothetical protein
VTYMSCSCAHSSFLNCLPDIDKVLRGLDNVISYHNVASSEDQDIRDGLVHVSTLLNYSKLFFLHEACLIDPCSLLHAYQGLS